MNKKLFILALGAVMTAVSCQQKNKEIIDPEVDLVGDITENRILEEGQTYTLTGGLHVKAGATLTIEPGVTIVAQDDDQVDYILIEQGAMIDARGTADKPIVMTSTKKQAGAWGGLHICGKAPINAGTDAKSEIGDASYGGNEPHDNPVRPRRVRRICLLRGERGQRLHILRRGRRHHSGSPPGHQRL